VSVVYEVTAVVEHDLAEEWERYMRERHIPDVLATGWFTRATLVRTQGGRYRICRLLRRGLGRPLPGGGVVWLAAGPRVVPAFHSREEPA